MRRHLFEIALQILNLVLTAVIPSELLETSYREAGGVLRPAEELTPISTFGSKNLSLPSEVIMVIVLSVGVSALVLGTGLVLLDVAVQRRDQTVRRIN